MSDPTFRQRLEQHNNPDEVRQRLAAGNYNQAHASVAREWLDSLDRAKSEKEAASRAAREASILEIAKEANRLASEANEIARSQAAAAWRAARYAMYAAAIAAAAAVIANKETILALISGQP